MTMTEAHNALMSAAWRDFILWAGKDPEVLRAYTEDTGRVYPPRMRSPLERAIDRATGHKPPDGKEEMVDFIAWVTEKMWGDEYVPEEFRRIMRERETGRKA